MLLCPRRLKKLTLVRCRVDPSARRVKMFLVALNPDEFAPELHAGNSGCPGAHERVAHGLRLRVHVQAPGHQPHRLLRRVFLAVLRGLRPRQRQHARGLVLATPCKLAVGKREVPLPLVPN